MSVNGDSSESEATMVNMRKITKWIICLPLFLLALIGLLFVIAQFASGYVDFVIHGQKIVAEVTSPDGQYIAYVEDMPSLDGPNQSLMIERADQTRFLGIAQLTGDVDSIKEILWAPDSSFVVYHSHCYLTITRISDWQTQRIYLGHEWRRAEPKRKTTFCSAMPDRFVEAIDFPEQGKLSYRIKDDAQLYTVKID